MTMSPALLKYPLLLGLGLLSGCQQLPLGEPPAEQTTTAQQTPSLPPKQYASFSQDTLFSLLAAELAGQRNRFDLALDNYLTQARATGDAGVAERAFRIAEYLDDGPASLESAQLWAKSAPDSLDAQRNAAIQLARAGQHEQAMQVMERVLQQKGDTHFDFLALAAADTDERTRAGLLDGFQRLLERYPDNQQLLFGQALLLYQDGRNEEALQQLQRLPQASQASAILLQARLLQDLGRHEQALKRLRQGIGQHPTDKRLRLAEARLLLQQEDLQAAGEAFAELLQRFPEDDDLRLSLALISLENRDWERAHQHLGELLLRQVHVDAAHFHLGRLYEQQNEPEEALQAYTQVGPGSDYLPAQARIAQLLADSQRFAELSSLLQQARQQQAEQAVALYLLEAETLAEAQRGEAAWQLIEQALRQYPDDLNLLYTRAMLAEQRDDLVQLEADLRFILSQEPDNAMALNALGYTLADRTERYDEALQLIELAHQINPQDPAILDSLGWVHYRLGNLQQAEQYLRQAFAAFPDHEVAAHLGEVLWLRGKQREARQVWRQALDAQPDSPILRETLLRLTGEEHP